MHFLGKKSSRMLQQQLRLMPLRMLWPSHRPKTELSGEMRCIFEDFEAIYIHLPLFFVDLGYYQIFYRSSIWTRLERVSGIRSERLRVQLVQLLTLAVFHHPCFKIPVRFARCTPISFLRTTESLQRGCCGMQSSAHWMALQAKIGCVWLHVSRACTTSPCRKWQVIIGLKL